MKTSDKCVRCGNARGEHLAKIYRCPVGHKSRAGWISYHATQSFCMVKVGQLVKLKGIVGIQQVVGIPFDDRIDVRPQGQKEGRIGVPAEWVEKIL